EKVRNGFHALSSAPHPATDAHDSCLPACTPFPVALPPPATRSVAFILDDTLALEKTHGLTKLVIICTAQLEARHGFALLVILAFSLFRSGLFLHACQMADQVDFTHAFGRTVLGLFDDDVRLDALGLDRTAVRRVIARRGELD